MTAKLLNPLGLVHFHEHGSVVTKRPKATISWAGGEMQLIVKEILELTVSSPMGIIEVEVIHRPLRISLRRSKNILLNAPTGLVEI